MACFWLRYGNAARWSIYAVDWRGGGDGEERITPAGVDVMTPAAAPSVPWLAVATRAGNSRRSAPSNINSTYSPNRQPCMQ